MLTSIPFQVNDGGIVALLPDGRVEFLDPAIRPLIDAINAGEQNPQDVDFDSYIITDPLVDLDRFHLSSPVLAFIEITNLCNLRCKHCYADSAVKRPNEMSTERIMKLIDEFAEMGVLQLFLTGGEVFSHPDCVEIINYAMTKPFRTQVFTNGLMITEEKLAALTPGVSFFISFDTADPVRTIRGGMDYPKLRERFEWMEKYGHVLRTAISVHAYNINDAEEIFDFCARNGYPRPQWLETHPIGRALLHPDLFLTPDKIDEVFEIYKRCMEKYTVNPAQQDEEELVTGTEGKVFALQTIKFTQRLEQATGQEKCARSLVYINSSGDVYPCSNCMSSAMYAGGNLHNSSFKEVWEQGFDEFRNILFAQYDVCNSCDVNKVDAWCQFRCPPLSYNVSKDIHGCGATDYLKLFMLKSHAYWEARKSQNIKLTLAPTAYQD